MSHFCLIGRRIPLDGRQVQVAQRGQFTGRPLDTTEADVGQWIGELLDAVVVVIDEDGQRLFHYNEQAPLISERAQNETSITWWRSPLNKRFSRSWQMVGSVFFIRKSSTKSHKVAVFTPTGQRHWVDSTMLTKSCDNWRILVDIVTTVRGGKPSAHFCPYEGFSDVRNT